MTSKRWSTVALAAVLILPLAGPGLADENADLEALRQEIEALRRRDAERAHEIDELRREIRRLHQAAPVQTSETAPTPARAPAAPGGFGSSALDRAVEALAPPAAAPAGNPATTGDAVFRRRLGRAELKLLDIGMDLLWAAGGSSAPDPEIKGLQQGGHDPRRRGFTMQQAELSLSGAVDPYVRGDVFLVATPDGVELEEAFLTSTALPWGLQLEAGTFFTEFGLNNPQHPHQWDWVDQPVINSRLFGGEGLRGPGLRVGWLTPLPWFSELHVGLQNPNEGEHTSSFIGEEQVGGRPLVKQNVDNLQDLLYLARWVNSWDVDDSLTSKVGVSGLFGPNGTGGDGRTYVYGADMLWKWQPPDSFRGWPFVTWRGEVMKRDFRAGRFVPGTAVGGDSASEDGLSSAILRDWGFYSQVLWGFRHPWALGLRYEYASGSGTTLPDGRNQDALRDDRHRLSPLIVWQPTEFTRFRLQYNFDRARFLDDDEAHSIWFAVEILYGAHMAHEY